MIFNWILVNKFAIGTPLTNQKDKSFSSKFIQDYLENQSKSNTKRYRADMWEKANPINTKG